MVKLADFAERYAAMPCLGYTHYQPAQLVTVGKRATLWLQDLMLDIEELDDVLAAIRFLGCRGTTGTEASFLALFNGDTTKIDEMNRLIAADFGFDRLYDVCGQTYPRKLDSRILNVLSSLRRAATGLRPTSASCSTTVSSRSRSRRRRSAPLRCRISATRCAASASALWRAT